MTFSGSRVVFSGPFRARLALALTDVADRNRWDHEHLEAVAADFLVGWDDLDEQPSSAPIDPRAYRAGEYSRAASSPDCYLWL